MIGYLASLNIWCPEGFSVYQIYWPDIRFNKYYDEKLIVMIRYTNMGWISGKWVGTWAGYPVTGQEYGPDIG